MAPRLSKRQIREQEELAALETVETPDLSGGEDERGDEDVTTAPSGFAALMHLGGGVSEEEEEDTPRSTAAKKKKKKKKTSTSSPALAGSPKPSTPDPGAKSPGSTKSTTTTGPKKKQSSKKKGKGQKGDDYDIDKALAELSLQYPTLQKPSESSRLAQASNSFFSLLSVSTQHLDSEAEMRKFFGSKVVSASNAADSSSSSSAQGRNQRVDARSILTRPQPTWWPTSLRQGLSIRTLTPEEIGNLDTRHGFKGEVTGEKVWTVEFSNKYRGVSKTFIQMVMSGDPEGFYQIIRLFPYHADTVLQLSEVYFHREEHSTAADFIDRALFTYERAFSGAFSLTSGTNRLDFDHVENRPFFLAVHRKTTDLQRRGCLRTSFEFAKLLYSLDPSTDPHGALLHLDFLSIKAGAPQWLLEIWEAYGKMNEDQLIGRFDVRALPGWTYARALALFIAEETKIEKNHDESTAALKEAVLAFPSVVPLLADKIDAAVLGGIRGHPALRIHTDATTLSSESDAILHLLSHLYAQRSFSIWKPRARTAWFTNTVNSLSPLPNQFSHSSTKAFHALFSSPSLRYSVYRHVLVNETTCKRVFPFIPTAVINAKQLACDPLPPMTKVNEYDTEFFKGTEDPFTIRPRGRRETERLLERLVPDPVFRRQLQEFFGANPQFAQRFPGGIVQFAQIAGQLPEEVLEDMMIAEVDAGLGGRGQGEMHMPGMFGAEDDAGNGAAGGAGEVPAHDLPPERADLEEVLSDEEGDDEDDEDLDVPVQPLPIRFLRNVLNRFWGGGGTQANEEESSDDGGGQDIPHPPVDPNDVD